MTDIKTPDLLTALTTRSLSDLLCLWDVDEAGAEKMKQITLTDFFKQGFAISAGRLSLTQTTITTSQTNLGVSGVNVINIDTTSGSVTLSGLSGGAQGQTLFIFKSVAANDLVISNAAAAGDQDILTHDGSNITLSNYGGLILQCNGSDWFVVNFADVSPVGAGTDNRLARYDGTDAIQQSGITIDDSDNVTGVVNLTLSGRGVFNTATVTASQTNLSVSGVNVIKVDTTSGNVVLSGLTGGTNGQTLIVYKSVSANSLTFSNAAAAGDQDILTHDGSNIVLDTYGGAMLQCDGSDWFVVQSASGGGSIGAGTDNRLARYDGTDAIQQSGITIDDSDNVTGVVSVTATTGSFTGSLSAAEKIVIPLDEPTSLENGCIWIV